MQVSIKPTYILELYGTRPDPTQRVPRFPGTPVVPFQSCASEPLPIPYSLFPVPYSLFP